MQPEIDPSLAFVNKFFLTLFAALLKKLRLRAFHRKIRIPALVMHLPDTSHTTPDGVGNDLIFISYASSLGDLLISDGIIAGKETG